MIEAEAHALAAKRNAHKGKALWQKEWSAVEYGDGSWGVQLVDSAALRMQQASQAHATAHRERLMAIGSLLNGDMEGFEQHADAALDATLKSMVL